MKIAGKRTVAAPYSAIEAILADGQALATAVPHFQLLSPLAADQHRGRVTITAGPLQGKYEGTFVFTRPEAGVTAVTFDGHGATGIFRGNGRIQLEAQGEQTIIHYAGEITVAGQLAAVPSRLLQANLNAIVRRILEGIDRLLWPEKYVVQKTEQPPSTQLQRRNTAVPGLILAVLSGFLLIYFMMRRDNRHETTKT